MVRFPASRQKFRTPGVGDWNWRNFLQFIGSATCFTPPRCIVKLRRRTPLCSFSILATPEKIWINLLHFSTLYTYFYYKRVHWNRITWFKLTYFCQNTNQFLLYVAMLPKIKIEISEYKYKLMQLIRYLQVKAHQFLRREAGR